MLQLKENQGIPRSMLLMMSVIAGLTVANCYYNQPLLELIRHDLNISEGTANLITVLTQVGYAIGLCFIIPMGDLFSRRRIVAVSMTMSAIMATVMAFAHSETDAGRACLSALFNLLEIYACFHVLVGFMYSGCKDNAFPVNVPNNPEETCKRLK